MGTFIREILKTDNAKTEKVSVILNIKKSIIVGVGGYFLFLFILFVTKIVSVLIQTSGQLKVEFNDFIISIIGFILLSLIKFLENFRDRETI